jgi:hypothetical protein
MKAKTNWEIQEILDLISYRDWDIVFREEGARPYLQIQFMAPDCFTGIPERQYCRKWMLSRFMTKSEIVRSAYKAIEAAVLHELQEEFKFIGEPVYRPHIDVMALWEISRNNRIDKRD